MQSQFGGHVMGRLVVFAPCGSLCYTEAWPLWIALFQGLDSCRPTAPGKPDEGLVTSGLDESKAPAFRPGRVGFGAMVSPPGLEPGITA